jgi:hypothetical protein
MAKDDTPKALIEALDMVRGTGGPAPQSLDPLESRHINRIRTIFEDRNIIGVGIADKYTQKKNTGELVLCFYVEKKIARSRMKINKMIPPVLSVADRQAVFTDIQAIGKVRPEINKQRAPIVSGFSVGNSVDTGTLGAIVKKGTKLFLLSNSHVLAKSGKGKVGDVIVYPGNADNTGAKQAIATLSNIVPFVLGNDFNNRIDAALAEIKKSITIKLDFSIRGAKKPFETVAPVRGMKIVTRGRTSGNTEGEVQDVHFSVVMPYPGIGTVGFIDQVKCTNYSKGGDSGAVIVDKASKKIVGLHFAGSGSASMFNPIAEVMKVLKFRFTDQ